MFKCLKSVFTVMAICLFVIALSCPVSCRLTEEGIQILSGDNECPVIESFEVKSDRSVKLSCSEKILLSEILLEEKEGDEYQEVESQINDLVYDETGKSCEINFSQGTAVGKAYRLSLKVVDLSGNSIYMEKGFAGFNSNPAILVLSEIRTKYDKTKLLSDYIEFYVLKSGNTYGYVVYGGGHGNAAVENDVSRYEFPSMEVKQGEYITLHSKIFDREASVNETSTQLNLSTALESHNQGRDLWRGCEQNVITNNDVIILENFCTGKIYDGILMNVNTEGSWSKKLLEQYAEKLHENQIWLDGSQVSDAVYTKDISNSVYRSLSRINIELLQKNFNADNSFVVRSSKDDWKVTDKTGTGANVVSGATPGFANSKNYLEKD